MDVAQSPSLESRLDLLSKEVSRLQKSNRRLRIISLVVGLAVLGSLCVAASPPANGILEANGLVIRDDKGKVRATLGFDGEKIVGLKFYEGGKVVMDQQVASGAGSIGFYYNDGKSSMVLVGGGPVEPSLEVYDRKGDARVQASLFEGRPSFSLLHSRLATRFQIGVHSDGIPFMDFFNQKDKILPMLDKSGVPIGVKK